MSSDVVLGIDLGTTNSVVAVADGQDVKVLTDSLGNRLIPSVVSFTPDGKVLVGEEARERRLLDAENTIYSVKRLIGRPFRSREVKEAQDRFAFKLGENASGGVVVDIRGESFTLTEISAFVLREVRRIAEASLGFSCERAVVTVPANFNELQRSATKAAGRVAGLDVIRIINEPTAAALAYGYGKDSPERVAIYDLGGGTFDLTILELENDVFEVVATAGDSFLGGDDLDIAVADIMADAFREQHHWDPREDQQAYERLRAAAEWAKCQLSDEPMVGLTIEELAYGAGGAPLDLKFELSREHFEQKIQQVVARSFDVCVEGLKEAGIKAKDVDSVVLVGGSTRVPLVRQMVGQFFSAEPRTRIDPDLVVAQGAALHGYSVRGKGKRRKNQALGRVALKKVSAAELKRLRQKREERRAALPNQPAFAPNIQVEELAPEPTMARVDPRAEAFPGAAIPGAVMPGTVMPSGRGAPPPPPPPPLSREARTVAAAPPLPELPPSESTQLDARPRIDELPGVIGGFDDAPLPGATGAIADGPPLPGVLGDDSSDGSFGSDFDDSSFGGSDFGGSDFGAPLPSVLGSEPPLPGFDDEPPLPSALADVPVPAAFGSSPPLPGVLGGDDSTRDVSDAVALASTMMLDDGPPPPPPAAPPPIPVRPVGSRTIAGMPAVVPPGGLPPGLPPAGVPAAPAHPAMATVQTGWAPTPPVAPPSTGSIEMGDADAPLLMDVTPHSLGIETAGGFTQHLIRRNAPIPAEQHRVFSTAADGQTSVVVKIAQGEERAFVQNQVLGQIELTGLRPAHRGEVRIDVTFLIDASGTLDVKAIDQSTGQLQRTRINLLGGSDDSEIEAMRQRQQALMG